MALTYTQLSAITTNKFLPKLVDNFYNSKAMIKRFMRPGMLKLKDGGISIQGPIINSAPSAGADRFYDGYDTLASEPSDDITAFILDWKQQQEPVKISRKELLQNKGDSAKLSLIASKSKIAQKNMTDVMGKGLFSDGTAATGALTTKQYTGLDAILSTSSTYGGIAVADLATWVANIDENSDVDRALTLNLMQKIFGECSIDEEKPTVWVSRQNVYDQAWALFQPHQRIMSSEMGKLGFRALEVNGIPYVVDSHAAAKSLYCLNENNLYMVAHKDENMRIEKFDKLESQNGILNRIFFMGNLVCDARRLQGLVEDIAVAS